MSAGSSVRGAGGRRSVIGDEGVVEAWWCSWARRFRTRVWRGVGDDVDGESVAADDDDEEEECDIIDDVGVEWHYGSEVEHDERIQR